MLDLLRLSITLNFHFPLNLIKMYIKIIIYLSFIYANLCNLEFRLYIKKIHLYYLYLLVLLLLLFSVAPFYFSFKD